MHPILRIFSYYYHPSLHYIRPFESYAMVGVGKGAWRSGTLYRSNHSAASRPPSWSSVLIGSRCRHCRVCLWSRFRSITKCYQPLPDFLPPMLKWLVLLVWSDRLVSLGRPYSEYSTDDYQCLPINTGGPNTPSDGNVIPLPNSTRHYLLLDLALPRPQAWLTNRPPPTWTRFKYTHNEQARTG